MLLLLLLFLLPLLMAAAERQLNQRQAGVPWWQARSDSSGQAPDPRQVTEAVVQVYAARAVRWRGIFGVHTWIAVKPAAAAQYTRYEVFGWGVRHGRPAIRVATGIKPDGYWFGSTPQKLVDLRGPAAETAIRDVQAAVERYPHNHTYTIWPGPNSNTFVAHIGREVPELRLHLPPTAIGKDYLAEGGLLARSPSGTGFQLSLFGLLGVLVGIEEGIELNLLGLTVGVDVLRPALKLPGLGRLGFSH